MPNIIPCAEFVASLPNHRKEEILKVKPAFVAIPIALAIGVSMGAAPVTLSASSSVAVQAPAASSEQIGAAAKAIAAAVKALGGPAVKAAKAAMVSFTKFKAWYNGLPWYIRALGSGLNLLSLYDAIKGLF